MQLTDHWYDILLDRKRRRAFVRSIGLVGRGERRWLVLVALYKRRYSRGYNLHDILEDGRRECVMACLVGEGILGERER